MSVKFLDDVGLDYFWGKIKAWCSSTFAVITHSHAWSTITNKPTTISGYGITDAKIANGTITLGSDSITPLTSHQTLPTLSRTISGSGNAITDITVSNHAITATKGSTFLTSHQSLSHLVPQAPAALPTGNLTQDGLQLVEVYHNDYPTTYGNVINVQGSTHKGAGQLLLGWSASNNGIANIYYRNKRDAATTWSDWKQIAFTDSNITGTASNVTGTVAIANGGTGATTRLDAVKALTNESVGTSAQYFLTITDHWGKAGYTSIADAKTALGLKSAAYTESSAYVDVTSNQTVAGEKTFTNRISANFSTPYIVIANTDYTKGTNPSNVKYSRLFFSDTTGDVVNHRIAMVETAINASGRTSIVLGAYKFSSTETAAWGGIGVYYDADGTGAYTSAPNPPGDDASSKIATTYFVNQNYVTRATDQTISGKKTFTQELHFKNGGIASPTSVLTAAKYFNLMFVANDNNLLGRFLYYNNANNGTRGISVDLVDNTNVRHTVFTYAIVAGGTSGTVTTGDCITKFCPTIANCTLGGNSTTQRWGQIYSSITTISTSDERVKTEIANVPDEVLDCWEDVSWVQFKMVASVKEKGDSARLHNGMIAQNIKSVFESSGLDASKYGLFCYDEWDAEDATYDDEGNVTRQRQEAGNLYSLRYEEALCMEAAFQRRENARLKKRIADLEERLAALELKVS